MKKLIITCLIFAMLLGMLPVVTLAENTTPAFSGFSLYLEDSIALSFNVKAADMDVAAFTKVEFYKNDVLVQTVEQLPAVSDDLYKFRCNALRPDELSEPITAKLYVNGEEVHSVTKRAVDYCNAVLGDVNASENLRELIVGTMNYGAAAQAYTENANTAVNSNLSDADQAKGEENVQVSYNGAVANIPDGATVTWKEAGLLLKDSVKLQFVFEAESVEGLSIYIACGEQSWTLEQKDIKKISDGKYEVTFADLNPAQMRSVVTAVAKVEGVAVSGELSYSIESYAHRVQNDDTASAELKAMVTAMIHYGDAAAAYVAPKAEHEFDANGKCTTCTSAHYMLGDGASIVQAEDANPMLTTDTTVNKIPLVSFENPAASGGEVLRTVSTGGHTAENAPAHFSFDITPTTSGKYYIWAKVLTVASSSIYRNIDGDTVGEKNTADGKYVFQQIGTTSNYSDEGFANGTYSGTCSDFVWVRIGSYSSNPYQWTAGQTYTVRFRSNNIGIAFDEFLVVNSATFNPVDHTHTYGAYDYDQDYHWQKVTCCEGVASSKVAHTYNAGKCVCGKSEYVYHTFEAENCTVNLTDFNSKTPTNKLAAITGGNGSQVVNLTDRVISGNPPTLATVPPTISFTYIPETTDTYYVWILMDSYQYIRAHVPGVDTDYQNAGYSSDSGYNWYRLGQYVYNENMVVWNASEKYEVSLANYYATNIDKFVVTNDPAYVPYAVEYAEVNTNNGTGEIEAELTYKPNEFVKPVSTTDKNATFGTIGVPDLSKYETYHTNHADLPADIAFKVNAAESGTYSVWAYVKMGTTNHYKAFVNIDDAESGYYYEYKEYTEMVNGSYKWVKIGEYTAENADETFYVRLRGYQLVNAVFDKFVVTTGTEAPTA